MAKQRNVYNLLTFRGGHPRAFPAHPPHARGCYWENLSEFVDLVVRIDMF